MYGTRLDEFVKLGFEGEELPDSADDIELDAFNIGRKMAGLKSNVITTLRAIDKYKPESWKTLQVTW